MMFSLLAAHAFRGHNMLSVFAANCSTGSWRLSVYICRHSSAGTESTIAIEGALYRCGKAQPFVSRSAEKRSNSACMSFN